MLGALITLLCANETYLRTNLILQEVQEAERLVEAGNYKEARSLLDHASIPGSGGVKNRVDDLYAVIALRTSKKKTKDTAWVLPHFASRQKEFKTDPRYQAWLAEAQLAQGSSIEALRLINELRDKDLMPDAHAYVVLAKLSISKQRASALDACKTRAQQKSICRV
jgi:hypothetical protein